MSGRKPILLVTGAGGQIGQELVRMKDAPFEIVGMDRGQLDITKSAECVAVIGSLKPDVVVHSAAYTAVDKAESEPEAAWEVNVAGTGNVAKAAESVGAMFCYISTDYVFNGQGSVPYSENHETDPQTIYGKTKLEGEKMAARWSSKLFIVRTSWVYGKYGHNFVRTMLRIAQSKREISVVNDQLGSPTYTADLVSKLLELIHSELYGTYHISNSGQCSWFEFAQAIFKEAEVKGVTVFPCTTEQFPRPAPRPKYSVLGHSALIQAGFSPLRHWREALRDFMSDA